MPENEMSVEEALDIIKAYLSIRVMSGMGMNRVDRAVLTVINELNKALQECKSRKCGGSDAE